MKRQRILNVIRFSSPVANFIKFYAYWCLYILLVLRRKVSALFLFFFFFFLPKLVPEDENCRNWRKSLKVVENRWNKSILRHFAKKIKTFQSSKRNFQCENALKIKKIIKKCFFQIQKIRNGSKRKKILQSKKKFFFFF